MVGIFAKSVPKIPRKKIVEIQIMDEEEEEKTLERDMECNG